MKNLALQNPSFRYVEKSFKDWLDVLGYADKTVYNLPHHVREFLYYLEQQGCTQLNQITIKIIKKYYKQLKMRSNQRKTGALSNGSLNKHQQALKKFTDYLRNSGRLELEELRFKSEKEREEKFTIVTEEEIKQLYKVCKEIPHHPLNTSGNKYQAIAQRDLSMLAIFYGAGLRRNEGCNLDVSDINWDRGTLHVRKGKNYKERLVPINKTNLTYVRDYIYEGRKEMLGDKKSEALFISQRGQRINGQSILLRLKLLQKRTENLPTGQAGTNLIEKEIGLHTLRHSIATHLLSSGMKLELISKFLGHSSLESTQVYTHLLEEVDSIDTQIL